MKRLMILLIRLYRTYLSPLKGGPTCRFYPSCSEYAIQALTRYGVIKGTGLALWRLLRCNPFNDGGYDPLK